MSERPNVPPTPRLSSCAGLVQAGVIESFQFDPFTGTVALVYARDYLRVLRAVDTPLVIEELAGAILIDDPVAFRTALDRAVASLSEQGSRDGSDG